MNVAFDKWIPVVDLDGKRELASLVDVLTEGSQYADLAVRPHERVSLMRLLVCISHAALDGPKDYKEWQDVPKKLPDASEKYLSMWKDWFELFHKVKPWLQIADLRGVKKNGDKSGRTSPVAMLNFELATGNNSTLFDHSGTNSSHQMSLDRKVLSLLTFQNFSSGGGLPIAQWKSTKTLQVGNPDAPCLSQSMAHCLLRGKSLAETIHLNLPTFENVRKTYRGLAMDRKRGEIYTDVGIGKPVWEFLPVSPLKESDEGINATRTYLGRLVPLSRWIRLIPNGDEMYCCNGFKYDTFKDEFAAEPTAAVRQVKITDKKRGEVNDRKLVRVDPSRAIWRELFALLVKRTADALGGPLAMSNAPNDSEFDFHICGLARDRASIDIAIESVFHITPVFHCNLATYQTEIQGDRAEKIIGAEGYSKRLRWAIQEYRSTIDSDWNPRVRRTEAKKQNALKDRLAQTGLLAYWTMIEKNLPLLTQHIDSIGSDQSLPTRSAWRRMIWHSAHDAYRIACGQETPRQIRAFAKGLEKLTMKRDEPETNTEESKEESV